MCTSGPIGVHLASADHLREATHCLVLVTAVDTTLRQPPVESVSVASRETAQAAHRVRFRAVVPGIGPTLTAHGRLATVPAFGLTNEGRPGGARGRTT
jgi:hypothetical protein